MARRVVAVLALAFGLALLAYDPQSLAEDADTRTAMRADSQSQSESSARTGATVDWATVSPEEVERLIAAGELDADGVTIVTADDGKELHWFPLLWLVKNNGNPDVAGVLVRHGANIEEVFLPHWGLTALDVSVRNGDVDMARRLLDLGAAIEHGAKIPVVVMAMKAKTDEQSRRKMIDLLLDRGADVNAPDIASKKYQVAVTPLMEAVIFSILDEENSGYYRWWIEYLVDRGANVNARPVGSALTAMHLAALSSNTDVMRQLVANGGDVRLQGNVRDACNDTPLSFFIESGHSMEVFDYIIQESGQLADVECANGGKRSLIVKALMRLISDEGHVWHRMFMAGSPMKSERVPYEKWQEFGGEIFDRMVEICRAESHEICDKMAFYGEGKSEIDKRCETFSEKFDDEKCVELRGILFASASFSEKIDKAMSLCVASDAKGECDKVAAGMRDTQQFCVENRLEICDMWQREMSDSCSAQENSHYLCDNVELQV